LTIHNLQSTFLFVNCQLQIVRALLFGVASALALTATGVRFVSAETEPLRLALLEAAGRTSIVIETPIPVGQIDQRSSAGHTLIVEFAAPGRKIHAEDYIPDRTEIITAPIQVRDAEIPGRARVILVTCSECEASARVSENRIYVDIVRRSASVTATENPVVRQDSERVPQSQTVDGRGSLHEIATASYELMAATARRQAEALAKRPSVSGLLALRAAVVQRDGELGRAQPNLMRQLLDDLDRATNEARTLQLANDRKAMLEAGRAKS
jgi:hypothetical protein